MGYGQVVNLSLIFVFFIGEILHFDAKVHGGVIGLIRTKLLPDFASASRIHIQTWKSVKEVNSHWVFSKFDLKMTIFS